MTGILARLLGKKKQPGVAPHLSSGIDSRNPDTIPIGPPKVNEIKLSPSLKSSQIPLELPQFIVGCGQSVGKQRDHNEDALFTLSTNLVCDNTQLPFGLYIIADGMGGHQHGEVAASVSVRALANYIVQKLYLPYLGLSGEQGDSSLQEVMQASVLDAHRSILKHALGGGTTLTAALVLGNQMTLAHVGDSRAYVIHPDGRMQTLTQDHSLVKRLEELGQITAEEAAVHPQRNVLYRALGQGEPFEPDVATFPMPPSGYLLICSDGLWGVVSDQDIFNIIVTAPNPHLACQLLIDAANAAGGPDNISVILVRMPD